MSSILTNITAMAALQTLRGLGQSLSDTQAQVSSGLRVGEAADSAAYWSISTTMRSDSMAISAVSDALGLGSAKTDVAYAQPNRSSISSPNNKARLVAASEEGVDRAKVQQELDQQNAEAESIVDAASFSV